jgi:acyl-CoA hydrolase
VTVRDLPETRGRFDDASEVVDLVAPGAQIVVPIANGEAVSLVDALEARHTELSGVRIHQMHALHDRPSIRGECGDHLRHVSYFLSHVTRKAFAAGLCDVVPSHFSEVPLHLERVVGPDLVLAAASPMDEHGFFSLGTGADYVAPLIGKVPFVLEVNRRMPRTFGRNTLHNSQTLGWVEVDRPLVEVTAPAPNADDEKIAAFVAERIPDGATIQVGIGGIPNAVMTLLEGHRHLGVHTELISDGLVELARAGVVTGVEKTLNPHKMVATFALGTQAVYDFMHENPSVEMWPVDYVNDPRVIARMDRFVSVNASLEVDLLGQCASESISGRLYSGSGGQADFARGAMYAKGGQGFICLPSTVKGEVSRIVGQLGAGQVVTTLKNTVDKVVTEWGVAELRGRTVAERARALIAVAHPDHRDALRHEARRLNFC